MNRDIPARVYSHISVDLEDLPEGVLERVIDTLTIPNAVRENAKARLIQGWQDMDEFIELYEVIDDMLILPRGFASQLVNIASAHQREILWEDERSYKAQFSIGKKIPAREYQAKFIEAIDEIEQGIGIAPPGAGKTVAALEIVRRHGRALVIVNTMEIADQWVNRAKQWLGENFPVGFVGAGEFETTAHLTIATQQTLWSRRQELRESRFFDQWNVVILDECHHATAETYRHILSEFSSRIRFGMSATPKKTGDFRLAESVLGPIIVEITDDDVGENTIKPHVEVINTKFGAVYRGDKKMSGGWIKRNNYQTVLQKLVKDSERNRLIANEIVLNHPCNANLVLSKQLKHLGFLRAALIDAGYPEEDIITLTGRDNRRERQETIRRIEHARCVVLSTLADEALDAPRLDRVHLTFPTKNPDLVIQQIGRIRRKHPEKRDAVVIDYRDLQVGPLDRQYMVRRHEAYDPKGLEVIKRKDHK